MAAKNVNIYSPGWIFFFIFFLVFNMYVAYHHTSHKSITRRIDPQPDLGGTPQDPNRSVDSEGMWNNAIGSDLVTADMQPRG